MPEAVIIPPLTEPFLFQLSGELHQIICHTESCILQAHTSFTAGLQHTGQPRLFFLERKPESLDNHLT